MDPILLTTLTIAPCALIALIVIVIAIRPSASKGVVDVLKALTGVMPWAGKDRQLPPTDPTS